jgi:hypothetical protein
MAVNILLIWQLKITSDLCINKKTKIMYKFDVFAFNNFELNKTGEKTFYNTRP